MQHQLFDSLKSVRFVCFNSAPYRAGIAEPRGKDYPPPANVEQMDRTNDCEIIVVNKNQR